MPGLSSEDRSFAPGSGFAGARGVEGPATLICFSHLRWDFVFQRPQHLMTRFAAHRPVIFFEEPIIEQDRTTPALRRNVCDKSGVVVATPLLPPGYDPETTDIAAKALLDELVDERAISRPIVWYYTPMMLSFSRHLDASVVVYDCMDELSHFRFAPPELVSREQELFEKADVVFTGGYSLWEAKRLQHDNVHPFPSSVDRAHFAQARELDRDAAIDQAGLIRPRLGYYGVIDERLDLDLIAALADARPDWSIVMVGPVVKVDLADLPRRNNVHYLGSKSYAQLPSYLAGWDVALMPFAINDATKFISPTKTPEYLAGGRPVVSTPITDVVRHYGDLEGVRIADTAEAFIAECEKALELSQKPQAWRPEVDKILSELSWDRTFARMAALIDEAAARRPGNPPLRVAGPAIVSSKPKRRPDYLIVGAGFAGSVLAERLANDAGKRVLVIDRRPHIGGNAYDHHDQAGVLIHKYGPHIFHTNSQEVFAYLSRFTAWRPYEHRVLASTRGLHVPMPINRTTLNMLYGLKLETDAEAEAFLASRAEPVEKIRTSEDVVVNAIGRELYERFFRGYTRKQWGMDPSELDKSVTSRVPTRTNLDDRYFTDRFQAMPLHGYTRMFENMLDHPNIEIELGVDHTEVEAEVEPGHTIFCGPIDEYFGHRFGELPYRSLKFDHQTLDREWFQPVATVNYPEEDVPYTRITEYKHLTGQTNPRTSITYEYPSAEGDPYYPIPRAENHALFKQYEALALQQRDVTFVGRLATYRYYNMDQVVGQALATYRRLREAETARAAEIAGHAGAPAS